MKLWQKTAMIIGVTLFLLAAAVFFASKYLLAGSYAAIEQHDTEQNVRRATDAIANEVTTLDSKAGDWANWDDAYAFAQGGDPGFIETNPTDTSFLQIGINLIVILDSTGNVIFAKSFDLQNQTQVPLPAAFTADLPDPRIKELFREIQNSERGASGIILLPEGPLLIAARPILTSLGQGPAAGTLAFGRYLDAAEIAKIANTTHLAISVYRFDDPLVPTDVKTGQAALSETNPIFVQPLSETSVAGYGRLTDIFGKPALALRVDNPRPVYQQGETTFRYLMLWIIGIAAVFGIVVQFVVNRLFATQRARSESEYQYRTVVEQAAEGIYLVDTKTKRLLQANAAFRNMLGYTSNEIFGLTISDILDADPETLEQEFCEIAAGKIHRIGERRYRRKDGILIDTVSSASLITDHDRAVITTVVRDVTETKRMEAERARLYQEEYRRREELDALYTLARALADTVDVETILGLIAREAVKTLHVTFARITLVEEGQLVVRATYPVRGLGRDLEIGLRKPISTQPYCTHLLQQDAPIVVHRNDPQVRDCGADLLLLDIAQWVCLVPVCVGNDAKGLIVLGEARGEERERFTPEKIRLAQGIADQAASAFYRAELFKELEESYLRTVLALSRAIDAKDTYTSDHSERLFAMARQIGMRLGMSPRELEDLRYGATLHDIGKIGVADAVLKKPGKLDPLEWQEIRRHPVIGAEILAPVPRLAGAAAIVRHHHERYDGRGYPDGLAGTAIPLGARILTVVDSYSAIVDQRVYKPARTPAEAIAELEKNAGTQFDPRIVQVFLEVLAPSAEDLGEERDRQPLLVAETPAII